ncbi:flavin reductase [Actinoplanes xinjiangensis]|uniref:flavin reductase n=1 Tax=Actinoplanes xinjiangensis TaxID=512350 RepID=UPI003436FAFD
MSAAVLHVPDRPSWKCHNCEAAWPCQLAKDDIMATSDRTSRMIYLSLYMADAIVDQPGVDPNAIFKRLVGWALGS